MSEIELSGSGLSPVTPSIIDQFNYVLMEMDSFRGGLTANGDWKALTEGLIQLQEFKKNLSVLIDSIEGDINSLLPEKKVVVEGLGIIEKRTSMSRKWESDTLIDHIVRECLDTGTGEITPSDVFRLVETLKKVLPLTASLGWRTTALKEIGFDPDSYSDVTFGRKTVTIKR